MATVIIVSEVLILFLILASYTVSWARKRRTKQSTIYKELVKRIGEPSYIKIADHKTVTALATYTSYLVKITWELPNEYKLVVTAPSKGAPLLEWKTRVYKDHFDIPCREPSDKPSVHRLLGEWTSEKREHFLNYVTHNYYHYYKKGLKEENRPDEVPDTSCISLPPDPDARKREIEEDVKLELFEEKLHP